MSIRELRFLTDENVDAELVTFLRSEGFNVLDIKEEQLFRLPDITILQMALDQQRVVISQDSDFGTLIFRDKNPFWGIIYLRPGHESPEIHLQSMVAILNAAFEFSIPFMLVAENTGEAVRIRLRHIQ